MKNATCTFSYGGATSAIQCARRLFHSHHKETKKINNQFLNKRSYFKNVTNSNNDIVLLARQARSYKHFERIRINQMTCIF